MKSDEYIGISDLIREIKKDLFRSVDDGSNLFTISEVVVEINFTVTGTAQGGINLGVVTLGSNISDNRVQKVSVKLAPLFSKDQLVKPGEKPSTAQVKALVRGDEEDSREG
jgi:hypothetical protein